MTYNCSRNKALPLPREFERSLRGRRAVIRNIGMWDAFHFCSGVVSLSCILSLSSPSQFALVGVLNRSVLSPNFYDLFRPFRADVPRTARSRWRWCRRVHCCGSQSISTKSASFSSRRCFFGFPGIKICNNSGRVNNAHRRPVCEECMQPSAASDASRPERE